MALFEITDSESDVSEKSIQPMEQTDCTDVAVVAAAGPNDIVSTQLIDQPTQDSAGCDVERVINEYWCGSSSKIGDPSNFVDNSRR
eukprot:5051429-Pyramimonas_sp.AAC.1